MDRITIRRPVSEGYMVEHIDVFEAVVPHPGFRMRVGDWRVVYLLDDERIVIQTVRIAQRGEIYR